MLDDGRRSRRILGDLLRTLEQLQLLSGRIKLPIQVVGGLRRRIKFITAVGKQSFRRGDDCLQLPPLGIPAFDFDLLAFDLGA